MAAISSQCHLPEDLITEILLRLPVKSLLKFISVCKQWHALIRSPSFMSRHFRHESNCTRLLVYGHWRVSGNDRVSRIVAFELFEDETLERYEELDNLKLPVSIDEIYGSCNGVFCVLSLGLKLALWNPATRRMRPLPSPSKEYAVDEIGFGVDFSTNEFKIVLIQGERGTFGHLDPNYVVYTSSNDSWKWYKDEALLDRDSCLFRTRFRTIFLNGFCYWKKYNMKTFNTTILAFDMHNEFFQEIEMPGIVESRREIMLDLYNDSLALFSYDERAYDVTAYDKHIDIWVMKEKGCWTKLLTCIVPFKSFYPIGFWFGKKVFLSAGDETREPVVYDPDSHKTTNFRVGKREIALAMWPFQYKESLVSVAGNGIPDYDFQSDVIRKFLSCRWCCEPELD